MMKVHKLVDIILMLNIETDTRAMVDLTDVFNKVMGF